MSLLVCGALWYKETADYSALTIQAVCFIGQAITPALVTRTWLMQVMNVFEVVVIANVLWLIENTY